MATKKSAVKSASGAQNVAAAAGKPVKSKKAASLTVKLPMASKPLDAAGLKKAKVGLMLAVNLPNLSKSGLQALEDFLEVANRSVVVILDSCLYEPKKPYGK